VRAETAGGDAGDHDDVAAALLAHGRQDELGEVVRAEGVGAHHALHFGGVGIGDGLAPAGDAGVVHEDIDVPEVGEDGFDHGLIGVPIFDGSGVGLRFAAGLFDFGDGFFGGLFIAAVVDGDGGAVF